MEDKSLLWIKAQSGGDAAEVSPFGGEAPPLMRLEL